MIDVFVSVRKPSTRGVNQRMIFGPLLFILLLLPLQSLLDVCFLDCYASADDISTISRFNLSIILVASLLLLNSVIGNFFIVLPSLKFKVLHSETQCLFVNCLRVFLTGSHAMEGYNNKIKNGFELIGVALESMLLFGNLITSVGFGRSYQMRRILSI